MKSHLKLWPFAFMLLAFVSCIKEEDPIEELPTTPTASQESNQIVWEWTELYLSIEKDLPGFRPAPTCRAIAYIAMGAYETAVPGMEHHNSLRSVIYNFPQPTLEYRASQIDWTIAVNAYYARVFKFFLFSATSEHLSNIDNLESTQLSLLSQNVPQGIVNNSIAWGQEVANEVINYSETDVEGASQARVARPTNYFPPANEGLWVPTAPDFGSAMFPYWGRVRTFAAGSDDLLSPPPATYDTASSSVWYKDNLEVANSVKNITYNDRWVAEFWSDDITGLTFSPPARIFAIANQVVELEGMNLEETLLFYCKLGIATNDAAVGAWKSKFTYNTERPQTFIQKYIDPTFQPILGEAINVSGITPSFPGYPSGHSTFAGVSWVIFDQFFGANYEFTDHCHEGRVEFNGYPRTYSSWKQMAEENAYSRIPLGVHIRLDCSEGLRLGKIIASRALNLNLNK